MEVSLMYRVPRPFGGAYLHLLNNVVSAHAAGFEIYLDIDETILSKIIEDLKFLGFENIDIKKMKVPKGLKYARPLSLKYDITLLKFGVDVLELNSMPLWLAAEGAKGSKGVLRFTAAAVRDVVVRVLAYSSKEVVTVSKVASKLIRRDLGLSARSVPNQPLPGLGSRVGEGKYVCFPSSYYYSYQGLDLFLEAVRRAGIEDKVLLIGKAKVNGFKSTTAMGIRELASAYSSCFAIVSPHRDTTPVPFFGSPTKVVDALATNKFLIASDLPSIRETIERNLEDGYGCVRFVRPGDVEELAEALEEVARERPSCSYKLKKGPIFELWEELYKSFSKRSA